MMVEVTPDGLLVLEWYEQMVREASTVPASQLEC